MSITKSKELPIDLARSHTGNSNVYYKQEQVNEDLHLLNGCECRERERESNVHENKSVQCEKENY